MYQNKFLHKQAATPLFDTAKKYLTQLGKGVQDKWNSLGEDTRDALKVAAPSALIAGTGSWLLGDEDRSVGRKALDSVLWGSGVGTAAFGGTKLANHLLRSKNEQQSPYNGMTVAELRNHYSKLARLYVDAFSA